MSFTDAQKALERRLGMNIWDIRDRILEMENDERWHFMRDNNISGGLIFLAPSQYPHKPKGYHEEEAQITIDEWLEEME